MKSVTFFSTSLILAAIPSAIAIPTVKGIDARWMKSGAKTVQESNSSPAAANAEQDYIVVLADDEKRPWPEVFKSMGWNTTETIAARSVDGNDLPTFRAFETDEGESIQTFGTHMRAFTMSMTQSAGDSIKALPNVAILEKDHKRAWAVMPRKPGSRPRNMPRSIATDGQTLPPGTFEITKRQSPAPGNPAGSFLQQSTAPWNLQRISSQGTVPSNGRRVTDLTFDYRFERKSGVGVDIYMIDSGFNVQHVDFGGRLKVIFSPAQDAGKDVIGHG
ncbi:Oryzin [Orbilia brochopaga]|nr:Oryzin [Drechslerella brochopaga]